MNIRVARLFGFGWVVLAFFPLKALAEETPEPSGIYVNADDFPKNPPVYANPEQAIVWTSTTARPGDSVLLSGAFSAAAKSVSIAPLAANTADLKGLIQRQGVAANLNRMDSTGIAFVIPPSFPKGAYAYRVSDASGFSYYGIANAPKILWALGTTGELAPGRAEAGGTLRIFGSDFPESARVFLTSSTGATIALTPTSGDDHSLVLDLPATIEPGAYKMRVGAGTIAANLSSEIAPIQIAAPRSIAGPTVRCPGLAGDGKADDTAPLQKCLDENGGAMPAPVTIRLGAGTYLISATLRLRRFQYLQGDGAGKTILQGSAAVATPDGWIEGESYFGVRNLTIQAPVYRHVIRSKSLLAADFRDVGDPKNSGHVRVSGVRIKILRKADVAPRSVGAICLAGPDIAVSQSEIDSTEMNIATPNDNIAVALTKANGAYIAGMKILMGTRGIGASIASSKHVVFMQNNVDARTATIGAAGLVLMRMRYGPSENHYVGQNTFRGFPGNALEGVTTDAGGGSYLGRIEGVAGTRLTLANLPDWAPRGFGEGFVLTVTGGKGVGQYRTVLNASGRAIDLSSAFAVAPDRTSVVAITPYEKNVIVSRNSFADFGTPAQLYGMTFGARIQGNTSTGSGPISLRSLRYGSGVGLPILGVEIYGNTVSGPSSGILFRETNYDAFIGAVAIRRNTLLDGATFSIANTDPWRLISVLTERNDMPFSASSVTKAKDSPAVLLREVE